MDRRRFLTGLAGLATAACSTTGPTTTTATPDSTSTGTENEPAVTGPDVGGSSSTGAPIPTSAAPPATVETSDRSGPARFVQRGSDEANAVALTFHTNGDPTLATALLDRLAARATPITAFVVGQWLVEHPEMGRRLLAEGHELGNHTWSHQTMGQLDRATIRQEIAGCAEVLATFVGGPSRWFRPSGMEIASEDVLIEAGAAGYPVVVGYNVDSLDFTDPGAVAVRRNISDVVAAGDIVSLHFGHPDTVGAIDPILDDLAEKGLRPVTLSALFGN